MPEIVVPDSFLTETLAQLSIPNDDLIPVIAITVGGLIAIVAIAGGIMRAIFSTRAREQTKRELAAYVAEGSIQPDDAVRILAVGEGNDAKELIAKRAADGWISAKKADQLIQALEKQNAAKA